jgi:hypothetical protein
LGAGGKAALGAPHTTASEHTRRNAGGSKHPPPSSARRAGHPATGTPATAAPTAVAPADRAPQRPSPEPTGTPALARSTGRTATDVTIPAGHQTPHRLLGNDLLRRNIECIGAKLRAGSLFTRPAMARLRGPPRRRRTGPVVKGRHHPPRRDGLSRPPWITPPGSGMGARPARRGDRRGSIPSLHGEHRQGLGRPCSGARVLVTRERTRRVAHPGGPALCPAPSGRGATHPDSRHGGAVTRVSPQPPTPQPRNPSGP